MNQTELQSTYKELKAKLDALPLTGMGSVLERQRLTGCLNNLKELAEFNSLELLKQCPFCGTFDVLVKSDDANDGEFYYKYVLCLNCEAEGPPADTEQLAIAAWNKRNT